MAAGQGFKTFVTGEVLTAGDVNGYLMQGINVFTNATARDAAITAPAEGQFAFTKDNNSLWYYDGAAWVASGATGDIEGVTAGVGISGGGTSGTVTVTNSMATAIDAKGDLVPGTGADTFARLAVGANDTILTADSSTATGLKWAAPAGGGGMTLLSTTSLSGAANVNLSGTLTGYNNLQIIVRNPQVAAGGQYVGFRLNSDTGTNYAFGFDTFASSNLTYFEGSGTSIVPQQNSISGNTANLVFVFDVYDINGTSSFKAVRLNTYEVGFGSGTPRIQHGAAVWRNAGAVTAVSVQNIAATNWTSGDVLLYGVK